MIKINLPRKYEIYEDTPVEFHKYKGWNKVSYSQLQSFNDPEYFGDYVAKYFAGVPDKGNIFADFGSMCGNYLENQANKDEYLDSEDYSALNKVVAMQEKDAVFEKEILIDLEPFGLQKTVLQGFIDKYSEKFGTLIDYKTGNIEKKASFYAGPEYRQTDLYCYDIESRGLPLKSSGVLMLSRKGNKLDKEAVHYNGTTPMGLRLSGEVKEISREYNRKETEEYIQNFVVPTCISISDYYKLYNKIFG